MSLVGTARSIAAGLFTLLPTPPMDCVENPFVGVGFATKSKVNGPMPGAGTEMNPAASATIADDKTPSTRLKPRPRREKCKTGARKIDAVMQGVVLRFQR